jgi:hypothetical protein
MEKKKRSPIMVIGFAVLLGFLVIALLNGTIRPSSVVAAKVGLALGTLLTADLLEVRSVPAGGVPSDAFKIIADVEGQMLTVGRAPGDFITKAVVGESAASGIPYQLQPVEIKPGLMVNPASLLAALDQYGKLHLAIEPAGGLQAGEILTLNLGEMYQALNADTQVILPTPTPQVAP